MAVASKGRPRYPTDSPTKRQYQARVGMYKSLFSTASFLARPSGLGHPFAAHARTCTVTTKALSVLAILGLLSHFLLESSVCPILQVSTLNRLELPSCGTGPTIHHLLLCPAGCQKGTHPRPQSRTLLAPLPISSSQPPTLSIHPHTRFHLLSHTAWQVPCR